MRGELLRQIKALAELGVDGVQFQDFFARPVDFNPDTGRTPTVLSGRAAWKLCMKSGGLAAAFGLSSPFPPTPFGIGR